MKPIHPSFVKSEIRQWTPLQTMKHVTGEQVDCEPIAPFLLQAVSIVPHSFRSKSTTSVRTAIASAVMVSRTLTPSKSRSAWKQAKRRAKKKAQRIGRITLFAEDTITTYMDNTVFHPKYYVHRDRVRIPVLPTVPHNSTIPKTIRYNAVTMKIVDTTEGCCYRLPTMEILFVILPRVTSVAVVGRRSEDDVNLMEEIIASAVATRRSAAKAMHATVDIGLRPQRGRHGVSMSASLRSSGSFLERVRQLCYRTERAMSGYIPAEDISRFDFVRDIACPFSTLLKENNGVFDVGENEEDKRSSRPGYSTAASTSRDFMSAAHVDKDFFYSTTTVRSALYSDGYGRKYDWNCYRDSPVAHHFIFPVHNVAVSLRPGDILVFNPTHYHCCSHKLDAYVDLPFYFTTFYVKTANVGGNDNRIPISELQEDILRSMNSTTNSSI
jgi:hypothetical protein